MRGLFAVVVMLICGGGSAFGDESAAPAGHSGGVTETVHAAVTTRDGRELRGELLSETVDTVTLRIGGIDTPFPRETLVSVVIEPRAEDLYAQRRPGLRDDDLAGRLALAEAMVERQAWELARMEFASLARTFPNDPTVQQRLGVVEAQIAIRQAPKAQSVVTDPTTAQPSDVRDEASPATRQIAGVTLLTDAQINAIRLWEIDLSRSPAVRIDAETIDLFFDRYRVVLPERFRGEEGRRAFRRLKPADQLDVFFDAKARDLYPRVTAVSDPPSMQAFRMKINPGYINRFVAPKLGSGAVEGLRLIPGRPYTDVPSAYTNFYALDRFTHQGRRMIDRNVPEDSLLLEWGLPRDLARFPAPLEGLDSYFKSRDDPRYVEVRDWIASLYSPRPEYGIELETDAPESPAPEVDAASSGEPESKDAAATQPTGLETP